MCESKDKWLKNFQPHKFSEGTMKSEKVKMLVTQSCPTLYDPMDSSLQGSSVCENLQARILEWVTIPLSRGSSQSRDQTWISLIAGRFYTIWATREAPKVL